MSEIYALSTTDDGTDDSQANPEGTGAPLEWLEERICEMAAHLAAGTCRFLQLVAEFDARRGWASWDLPSCAAWLAWKCQVAPGTAREQVRVARALTALPVITAEFAAGRMSYAKARALTRIATPQTEAGLAELTGPMTAAQCERFAAAHRNASDDEELANRAERRVRIHVAEDGSVRISAYLPATDGAVVLQALRAAAGDCEHPHRLHPDPAEDSDSAGPAETAGATGRSRAAECREGAVVCSRTADGTAPSADGDGDAGDAHGTAQAASGAVCRAGLADALVEVAGAYLSGKISAAGNPDLYQVIVHVGPEALTGGPADDSPAPTSAASGVSAETADSPPPAQRPGEPAPSSQPAAMDGVSAETPPGDPARTAASPAGAATSPAGRLTGHPAHPRRCHLDDGPAISPAAAQAIACHATITWMLHDHDGTLLDAGRRHRRATAALRRAVRERDNSRCQYPGCNSRRTDIHHIVPWAKGGKTRLRGLISLCEAHHVIVHAAGYLITPAPGGGFAFTRPDGQPLPASPPLPGSDGDLTRCHDAQITTETIIPAGLGDKLDLDLAIWASYANTRTTAQHEQNLAA